MSQAKAPRDFIDSLDDALDSSQFDKISGLINSIDPGQFSVDDAETAMKMLRKKRRFPELENLADVFATSGFEAPVVRRQLAQALIDQGRLDQAWRVLQVVDKHVGSEDPEKPEIVGLIGRTFKQKYIEGGGEDDLRKAVTAYEDGWTAQKGDYRWHGINLTALLTRAERDGVATGSSAKAGEVASKILAQIKDKQRSEELSIWDYGTAMEACLGLGDEAEAVKWASKYVKHPGADAFELGGTLRQLREVWQLDDLEVGKKLIPVFQYELLQRDGGMVQGETILAPENEGFEAIYGPEAYTRIEWLESLFARTSSVARIQHGTTGEPFGTGFVIKGSDLHDPWGEAPVLVTNAHVVSDQEVDEARLRPEEATAEFTRLPGRPKIMLGAKLFHSPKVELDAWVCRLEMPDGAGSLSLSFYNPSVPESGDRPQRIYVIGHPKGGDLVISLYGNELVEIQIPYVHYKSPTEGGSSGSPVLNRALQTFALHHKTREALEANEGVLLEQIRRALDGEST